MLVTDPISGQLVDNAELIARRSLAPGYTSGAAFTSTPSGIAAAGPSHSTVGPALGPHGEGMTFAPPPGPGTSAQVAWQKAGGLAGSGQTFQEFLKWWNKQKASLADAGINQNPYDWATSSGLTWGGMLDPKVQGIKAGAGTDVFKPGSDWRQFTNPSVLNEVGVQNVIQALTGIQDPAEARRRAELASQFAGLEQWRSNQAGDTGRVAGSPFLQNASMVGFSDPSALSLFLGQLNTDSRMGGMGNQYGIPQLQAQFAEREALVPSWAPGVAESLSAQGVPYLPVELLGSPEVQYQDSSQPLFGPGDNPASLFGLTGGQVGERSFYRSLSAEELLRDIAPTYWAYYHRGAGEPVPSGMESGLMFGSPVNTQNIPGPDGTYTQVYQESPVKGLTGRPQQIGAGTLAAEGMQGVTDPYELGRQLAGGLYNRWSAYGYPGTGSQSTVGGPRYNPQTRQWEEYRVSPFSGGYGNDPYFADFWAEPTFQPWQTLDPVTLQRLMALMGSITYSGV